MTLVVQDDTSYTTFLTLLSSFRLPSLLNQPSCVFTFLLDDVISLPSRLVLGTLPGPRFLPMIPSACLRPAPFPRYALPFRVVFPAFLLDALVGAPSLHSACAFHPLSAVSVGCLPDPLILPNDRAFP